MMADANDPVLVAMVRFRRVGRPVRGRMESTRTYAVILCPVFRRVVGHMPGFQRARSVTLNLERAAIRNSALPF